MNELNTLKFTSFTAVAVKDPLLLRRAKLAEKLSDQIAAATAAVSGTTHLVSRVRRVKSAAGVVSTEQVQRGVRTWWRQLDEKRWAVMLYYGSRQLEFAKNKNAVEVANMAGVVTVLETLRRAVLAGELDAQLTTAAAELKRGFKR